VALTQRRVFRDVATTLKSRLDSATAATASIIIDKFEGRAMWPMTDAEAVLFIITVALLVALAQVAG
jgi:hypothetical protein